MSRVQLQQAEADREKRWWWLQARVGGTGGQEVTMAATRLCHRQVTSAVTKSTTTVDKRWQESMPHKRKAVVVCNGWRELSRMADGEKKWQQETVAREGKDSGVAMMVAVLGDGGGGLQQWRWRTTVADNDSGRQCWHARLGGRLGWGRTRAGGKRRRRQRSGNDGCSSGRQRRLMKTAKSGGNGGGQQWHARSGGRLQWRRTRAGGKQQRH
jgi:hypothetical protein